MTGSGGRSCVSPSQHKLALASWRAPRTGHLYGKLVVDVSEAARYLEWLSHGSGETITLVHLVGKAVALALAAAPGLNGTVRLWWFRQRPTVDASFVVPGEQGQLVRIKVDRIDTLTPVEIAETLAAGVRQADRDGRSLSTPLRAARWLPTPILRRGLWLKGVIQGAFGLGLPLRGLRADPFGSCIITDVGAYGLDEAYVPPVPWAHAPLAIQLGAVRDVPAVNEGRLVLRRELTLTATLDPRFAASEESLSFVRVLRGVLEQPWQLEGRPGPPIQLGERGVGRLPLDDGVALEGSGPGPR
ncbi:MAG TPA: hypothetical protein ENK18_02825 [Deltaproteobacteria bacterium]|nr:hypothetical protein [Deltaproteobacteria bacterium]